MRILGLLILLVGLAAAFGREFADMIPGVAGIGFAGDYQPLGFSLIAVGSVMFLIGGRRRHSGPAARAGGKRRSKTSSIGYKQPEPDAEKRKTDITWGREGDPD